MDVRRMLLLAVERAAARTAFVDGPDSLTYEEWGRRVYGLARGLRELGVGHGDRVAYALRNSIDHATLYFALQTLGAVAVPINFRSKAGGVRYILENSEARAIVVEDASLKEQLGDLRGLTWIGAGDLRLEELVDEDGTEPPADVRPDHLSAILYTSGTTGPPKGVAMSHRNTFARFVTYLLSAGPRFGSEVRTFGAAPLYHTVGLQCVLCPTVFLHGTYYPVRELGGTAPLELIEHERLTYVFGSPTMFHLLVEADPEGRYDLSSVDHLTYGSAPMPPTLLAEMRRRFPNASVQEVYGTTEIAIPFVTVEPDEPGKLRMTADFRVRVVRPGGSPDDVCAPGEVGDLLVDVANEGTFLEYWRMPEKTAERIRDGWYATGDAFYRDEDDTYHITGRLDDLFISGAENIQPVEVEQCLAAHPGVADVAVIGTPHERWGEAVTALVVRRDPELTHEEIDRYCRASDLEDFKRPRRVLFVDAIERNPSGKIVRKELRDRYADEAVAADAAMSR
jgi:2-furoate---CoA ligase